ncbi:hypothetical protein I4F81_005858 [Pyropia yezoensis]|uniref:Uncharacterized protein n=1 Tax=Pyropia yezoensis TaxID=2788 RepID=A0ACC3BZW5_PYRYE|nr:hypothetical protein I4F81_005858 [Neopyropia yezoensis]
MVPILLLMRAAAGVCVPSRRHVRSAVHGRPAAGPPATSSRWRCPAVRVGAGGGVGRAVGLLGDAPSRFCLPSPLLPPAPFPVPPHYLSPCRLLLPSPSPPAAVCPV